MKFRFCISLITLLVVAFTSTGKDRVQVNIPTAEAEAEYIWSVIQEISFFEKNNYKISLPEGALIESLKKKAKNNTLSKFDLLNLKEFMKGIYNQSDYEKAYSKVKDNIDLIDKIVDQFSKFKFSWQFKEFETYTVTLTLYGPGGKFNASEGSILLYTTPLGEFKNYDNPTNTIIHEMVHIGLEESIINKHNVTHALKERIVDTFVSLNFKNQLPYYHIQDMGDNRIDHYLTKKSDFEHLEHHVHKVMKKNH